MTLTKFVFSVFALLLSSIVYAADPMTIKAPDIAENGAVVPLSIQLASPMLPGETLKIFSNGELAATVTTLGLSITHFSTRVRMFGTGAIEAELFSQNGQVIRARKPIRINIAATIPQTGSPEVYVRHRLKDNVLKSLFTNRMAASGHMSQVEYQVAPGSLTVRTTPLMSQHPYIAFTATQHLSNVEIFADGVNVTNRVSSSHREQSNAPH